MERKKKRGVGEATVLTGGKVVVIQLKNLTTRS